MTSPAPGPISRMSFATRRWPCPDGLLDIVLEITILGLDFAASIGNHSLLLQVLIADDLAGDFLHFAFRYFDAASDLIFVHDAFLVMIC